VSANVGTMHDSGSCSPKLGTPATSQPRIRSRVDRRVSNVTLASGPSRWPGRITGVAPATSTIHGRIRWTRLPIVGPIDDAGPDEAVDGALADREYPTVAVRHAAGIG